MARNRITFALAAAAILAIAGCGGGGGRVTSESEKAADAEIVNDAIARELTTVDAYTEGLRLLKGANLTIGREFRAQAQEHIDALTKAIRGLGGKVEAAEEEADLTEVKTPADFLAFAYEMESAAVAGDFSEVSKLSTPWPRSLLGSIAANQAQHLVLLRQALGAGPLASVPEAFESGTTPAPGEPAPAH